MASKRIKWKDRMPENDIKYCGFLSYRHLRIIAWACLIIAQISLILNLEAKLAPDTARTVDNVNLALSIVSGIPVPLFLLANFSTILHSRGNYKGLFIRYGGLAAGLYILANALIFYYGWRTMYAFDQTKNLVDAMKLFGMLLPALGKTGYMLNIFIDMLLVVLMFFFMNYEPRSKVFAGKRIILFRLLILLPIGYEVFAIFVKYFIGMGEWTIYSPVFFLLPSKPPLIFAAFVIIVLGLKISGRFYTFRHKRTQEDYERYITTKAHSLKTSIFIAIVFAIMALIDAALLILLFFSTIAKYNAAFPGITPEELELMILYRVQVFEDVGIGAATGLLLCVPLVILFSYTKKHKNPKVDTLIPIAGIALLLFTILDGMFEVITLNIPAFMEKMRQAMNETFPPEEEASLLARAALSLVRDIRL